MNCLLTLFIKGRVMRFKRIVVVSCNRLFTQSWTIETERWFNLDSISICHEVLMQNFRWREILWSFESNHMGSVDWDEIGLRRLSTWTHSVPIENVRYQKALGKTRYGCDRLQNEPGCRWIHRWGCHIWLSQRLRVQPAELRSAPASGSPWHFQEIDGCILLLGWYYLFVAAYRFALVLHDEVSASE